MSVLASLGGAFVSICHPASSLLIAVGVAVGIILGSIPGLSVAIAVVLFLPLAFSMTPPIGMNLLAAVYMGGISGGLISAILPNVLGTASSTTTCSDGHLTAKNGEAGRVLGYNIVLSFLGSMFSFLVLILCAPLLADTALKFAPAKNLGISFSALTMVAVLTPGSMVEGVLVGILGLVFALVDMAPIDRTPRFTFGGSSLMVGSDTLPILIGTFATSEILITAESVGNDRVEAMKMKPIKGFGSTWKESVYQIPNAIRSALMGTGVGILSGTGSSTPGALSYVTTKNMSKHPDEPGKDYPDGVVATEIVNNATIGGVVISLLVLDVPRDGVTVTMLGGLLTHGLSAGPLFFVKNADVVYGIFMACVSCSLFMLITELFRIKGFVQLLKIPKYIPMPFILALCCVGAYATNNHILDVQSVILLGAVGCLYRKFELPTTSFALCFLIGETVEIYLRRGIMQYKSFGASFKRPTFDIFSFVTIAAVVQSVYREWRMTRVRKMQHVLKRDK